MSANCPRCNLSVPNISNDEYYICNSNHCVVKEFTTDETFDWATVESTH